MGRLKDDFSFNKLFLEDNELSKRTLDLLNLTDDHERRKELTLLLKKYMNWGGESVAPETRGSPPKE